MPSRDGTPPARASAKREGWAGWAVRPEVPEGESAGRSRFRNRIRLPVPAPEPPT